MVAVIATAVKADGHREVRHPDRLELSYRYLFAEMLIFVGVAITYFVLPQFFPLALVIILAPMFLLVIDWARDARQPPGLPPISLKAARVYLAIEIFGLTAAILGEVIKMDRWSLLALVVVAIPVG